MSAPAVVTLLSDFGTRDGYVGVMKGVVAGIAPGAPLVDVAHDVEPGDVAGAAWALGRVWRRFPEGTVHLVVVDPGVGTPRRPLACLADGRFVVAPDNGVLTRVLAGAEGWRCVEVAEERYGLAPRSATFHGRDVFAPAAAHLAAGVDLDALGPSVTDPVRLEEPAPLRRPGSAECEGEVVHVDRFGNLVTNLPGPWLEGTAGAEVGDRWVPVGRTYGSVGPGALLALVNSDDRVEVAARGDSAAGLLRAGRGTPVRLLAEPPG